ncbi:MAG TPA: hypothetical protein PK344_13995, partial [Syntrophorhabdaceae bacterium]|nr:hypothetical protein [Syntrophorhabdaceae bacterium]
MNRKPIIDCRLSIIGITTTRSPNSNAPQQKRKREYWNEPYIEYRSSIVDYRSSALLRPGPS